MESATSSDFRTACDVGPGVMATVIAERVVSEMVEPASGRTVETGVGVRASVGADGVIPGLFAVGAGAAISRELDGVAVVVWPAVGVCASGTGSKIGVAGMTSGVGEGMPSATEMAGETERTAEIAAATGRTTHKVVKHHPRMTMMIRVKFTYQISLAPGVRLTEAQVSRPCIFSWFGKRRDLNPRCPGMS